VFHLVPYLVGVLGELNIYHNLVCFARNGDFTLRVSDTEELVGVIHSR